MFVWVCKKGGAIPYLVEVKETYVIDQLKNSIIVEQKLRNHDGYGAGAKDIYCDNKEGAAKCCVGASLISFQPVGLSDETPFWFTCPTQVPAAASPSVDMAMLKEVCKRAFREMQTDDEIQGFRNDMTPGSYVDSAVRILQEKGAYIQFTGGVGDPILTEAECAGARDVVAQPGAKENALVAYMTPLLAERFLPALPAHYELVNSEQYPWLPINEGASASQLYPGVLFCPHYLVQYRPPYEDVIPVPNGQYGSFSHDAISSLCGIGDARRKLDAKGKSDMIQCLEILSSQSERHVAKGFVYDADNCLLMTVINGVLSQMTSFSWVAPGTRRLMQEYFLPVIDPWHSAVEAACMGLSVTIPRFTSGALPPEGHAAALLGAGAFGRVFVASDQQGQRFALKVAHGKACDDLHWEYEIIDTLPPGARPAVVGVVPGSMWRGSVVLEHPGNDLRVAAFLMPTVGTPFERWTDIDDLEMARILAALSVLHEAGVTHGDARWKNVVWVPGLTEGTKRYLWVDLRFGGAAIPINFARDVKEFLRSVRRTPNLPAIEDYANTVHQATWTSEAEQLMEMRALWTA